MARWRFTSQSQQLLKPWKETAVRNGRKVLRIFPYGINRHRLEQVIHELEAPARTVSQPAQADVIFDCARAS